MRRKRHIQHKQEHRGRRQVGPERHRPRRGPLGDVEDRLGPGVEPPARGPGDRLQQLGIGRPQPQLVGIADGQPARLAAQDLACPCVWLNINWYDPGCVVSNSAW